MNILVFLPIIIPFSAGLLLLNFRENFRWQKGISFLSSLLMLAVSGFLLDAVNKSSVLVGQFGNWKPPFGIVFAIDTLSAIMILISAIVALTCLVYSFHDIGKVHMKGSYYALFQFLLFGVNGAFTTGDLFNLFVFFEVLLITSYVLLVLGNGNKQTKAGFNYLTLNLIGSTVFLTATGILLGQLGTLNMADIANRIGSIENKNLVTLVAVLFFFVFGLKSAMFPINNWLPDAYIAPPTAISAAFAGLLTKVGVYSMYRVFGTIFVHDVVFTHQHLLLPLAGFTMIFGVWGAVIQYNVRSILAFHSISQIGYILMGLSIFSPLALAGGIFHMVHHSLVKSSLFLIGGAMGKMGGTQNLKKLGGLLSASTALGVLFMIASMALAGIPPLSGFFSKLALIVSSLASDHPILVFSALFTSLFTLYSMIKIWRLGFWGSQSNSYNPLSREVLSSCVLSVFFVLLLTFTAKPLMKTCMRASEDLLNRKQYISAVLNSVPKRMLAREEMK